VIFDHANGTFNTWDPEKGAPLNWHMRNNLRLYCWKEIKMFGRKGWGRERNREERLHISLTGNRNLDIEEYVTVIESYDERDSRSHLLSKLEPNDRQLLELVAIHEVKWHVLAHLYGCKVKDVKQAYGKAIERAKIACSACTPIQHQSQS
jgi:hypothetical protein